MTTNRVYGAKMTTNKVHKEKSVGVEFAIGGLTGIATALLTNPADVLKTRLQLQGELAARGSYRRAYRSTFHAAVVIARQEGVLALQSGITPALGLQVIINGVRLGTYHFARRHGLTTNEAGDTNVARTAVLSGLVGAAAMIVGSPLYLAKVKLQARSARPASPNSPALSTALVLRSQWQEGGIRALYRDWHANVPRLFIGSAVQLTTFGLAVDSLRSLQTFNDRPLFLTFVASVISGTILVVSVHPFDVMATRLYNQGTNGQGKGVLYNGICDTIFKIFRTEGLTGLYKGLFPHWLRVAPYIVTSQTLYEKMAIMYDNYCK